jgi:hypothetical protein
MSNEWVEYEVSGTFGDSLDTVVPAEAEIVKGWHREKASSVRVYTLDGKYWVVLSHARRIAQIKEEESLTEAISTAEEFKETV